MLGDGNGAAFFAGLTDVGNIKAVLDKLVDITDHLARQNWVIPDLISPDDAGAGTTQLRHFKTTLARLTATIGARAVPASRGPADLMPWLLDLLSADWHEIATRVSDLIDSQRVVDYMDFFGIFDDPGTERYRRDQEDVDDFREQLDLVKQVVQK
eukprot:SAG22_NODE_978_length_6192_cov_2.764320_5_plen_155_part_00